MHNLMRLLTCLSLLITGGSSSSNDNDRLFEAIRAQDLQSVQHIVMTGDVDLDPPTQPNQVNKALAYAALYGNLDIVKYILDQGVDIDGEIAYGGTALLRAMEVEHNDISIFLIQAGADVNHPNAFGVSPMVGSAISGNLELMKLIIQYGGDIHRAHVLEVSETNGELAFNPIQWAVVRNNTACVALLIEAGASVHVKTHDSMTLLDLATKRSNPEIIQQIKEAL